MEVGSTIGYRRRVRVAEDGVRIARSALKNISGAGSADSAGFTTAHVGSTYR